MAKSDGSRKKNKKKKSSGKKLVSGPNAVAMKAKPPVENPFENIWSRRKFDVLGKKGKGEERPRGLARSRAIDKRKKTLLKEYEQSGKSSLFADKRIGERNDALGEFDKAILRFQHERQMRLSKKSKYNLSDGEDDDAALGSLSARDDFEDELPLDDDVDGNEIEKKSCILKQVAGRYVHDPLETALMDGEENKHKSKKEIMAEIIFKSKQAKAEKAKEKKEHEQLLEQLDKDFASLVQSQVLPSLTQPSKMAALKSLLNKGSTNEPRKKGEPMISTSKESFKQEQPDAYDKLVKEMALDMRARPSDRTKTPEELAQEVRERLEQLEEERQKRMVASDYSSDEDSGDHVDINNTSVAKPQSISGDDLGDSFSFDEESRNKKGWVDEIIERDATNNENEEDSLSEGSESDESGSDQEEREDDGKPANAMSLRDWEQSDDDNFSTDVEEEEERECEEVEGMDRKNAQKKEDDIALKSKAQKDDPTIADKRKASRKLAMGQLNDLPFILDAPSSLAELCSLLDNRTDAEVVEGINRIRACNAIRLAAENRKKMQVFYGILLQYFAFVANRKPLNFKLVNSLVKPLMEMSVDTPYFAAICARQRLLHIRTQFCEDIKNPERSCWPSLKTLLLLRLWSMIFPCSDFRHVVMTPAILLMCEYLMRCPIKSNRDIVIGSFLCSMVLSITRKSKKFCPEAIVFLQTLLLSALGQGSALLQHSQLYYLSELKVLKPWLRLRDRVSEIHALDFLLVMDLPEDSPFFSSDDFRAGVLISVIEALQGFVKIYEGCNSFPEIFSPISALLHEVVKQENMPDALQSNMKDVAQLIKAKADEIRTLRQPLQMRKQKPVPVKLVNPKLEENFVKGRNYDPDRDRAERKKLKRLLKSEAKGAARELRKDNYFLLEAKEKERKKVEMEKAEKYGKAKAFLQEQGHAFRSGQLGKGRKRRR